MKLFRWRGRTSKSAFRDRVCTALREKLPGAIIEATGDLDVHVSRFEPWVEPYNAELHRPVDRIRPRCPLLSADCELRRVRGDTLLTEVGSKRLPPVAKRRLSNVQSFALLAVGVQSVVGDRASLTAVFREGAFSKSKRSSRVSAY